MNNLSHQPRTYFEFSPEYECMLNVFREILKILFACYSSVISISISKHKYSGTL